MNKKQFYENYVKPYLKKGDRPFNRELFNDAKDNAHRDGVITDWQVQNWIYPMNDYFLAVSERRGRR